MPRSNLITEAMLREFEARNHEWHLRPAEYSEFWGQLVKAEEPLMVWFQRWVERMLDEEPLKKVCTTERGAGPARNLLSEVFLSGVWFGERRWAAREEDVFRDIQSLEELPVTDDQPE